MRALTSWLLLLACSGLSAAGRAQVSPESITAQARLLAPDLPGLSALSAESVPSLVATLVPPAGPTASASTDPRAIYEDVVHNSAVHLQGLSAQQRQQLFDTVFHHPVAGLDDGQKLKKYDPKGFIGFCFGRSMAVHLLARQMGLAEGSVRQLFIIGDLRVSAAIEWRFHVTALVRGDDGVWYAIDPLWGGPLAAAAWTASVQAWDKDHKAHLYLAPADTVLPDLAMVPGPGQETGSHIIELSFDPAGKPGFSPMAELGEGIFAVTSEAAAQYFRVVDSPVKAFDFESISVNGQTISYNGYFVDLMNDIGGVTPRPMSFAAPQQAGPKDWPLGLRMEGLKSLR